MGSYSGLLLALAVAGAALPAPAAGQTDPPRVCLDVEPEIAEARTDSPVFLVATLRRRIEGETACKGKIVEKGVARAIDFEVTGANDRDAAGLGSDSPESPDGTCEIRPSALTEARCIVPLWGDEEGLSTVRAWIDDDHEDPPQGVVEADRTEGADKAAEPGNGCVGDAPESGEPDCTDVIEIDRRDRPDCEPARDPAPPFDRILVYRYGEGVENGMYTIDHRGGSPRRLGEPPEDLRDFLWSPDHRKLALSTGFMHSLELSVMRADGTGRVALTDDFQVDEGAAWSPDSRQIAYASRNYRKSEPAQLKVIDASGGRAKRITNGAYDSTHPDWSPDGRRIVFATHGAGSVAGIATVEPDGDGRRMLVSAKAPLVHPQFSPDGRKVLYRKHLEEATDLLVVDRRGRVTRVAHHTAGGGSMISDFQWSPDGSKIAYEATSYSGRSELLVVDADGSDDVLIARHYGQGATLEPSWSPDSSLVVFQLPHWPYEPDVEGYLSDVWVASADGKCAQAITPTPAVAERRPAWMTPASSSNPYEL